MSPELLASLLVGLGVYQLVTVLPWMSARPSLEERLQRFDVDARLAQRTPWLTGPRPLLPWRTADAALRPLLEDLAGPAMRVLGAAGAVGGVLERDLRRLRPGTEPVRFIAQQLLVATVAAVASLSVLLATDHLTPTGLMLAATLGLLGFLWPYLRLRSAARARKQRILAELPQLIRLLAVAISAGLVPDAALERAARQSGGVLGTELRRLQQDVAAGRQRLLPALAALAQREEVPEMETLIAQLRAADEQGLPLARTLEVMATGLVERQAVRLMEVGEKGSVRMVLPLGLVLIPVIVVLALAPAVAAMRGLLGS